MRTSLLAVALILTLINQTRAQDEFDVHKVRDLVVIGNLLFAYQEKDFAGEAPADYSVADVIPPADAADKGEGEFEYLASELISWTLGYEFRFETDRMTLQHRGHRDWWFWSVSGPLQITPGGASGIPWTYRTWIRGDGAPIKPTIYLYNARYFAGDTYLRSYLDIDSLALQPGAIALTSDEIRTKAVDYLTKFMSDHVSETLTETPYPDQRTPVWKYHSQGLIEEEFHKPYTSWLEANRVWSVNFIDGDVDPSEDMPGPGSLNDMRRFHVWVTEDGRLGKLELGTDLHYDANFGD
jgi:hypothetical protein